MTFTKEYLEDLIKESADLIYEMSHNLCGHGVMDDNCVWYHSIWQYLRLLDLVSSPTWHDTFYIENIKNNLKDNSNILVSGTADYSMLAYIIGIVKKEDVKANIYVLDTCKTPLYACEWLSKKTGYPITVINEDILKYKNDNSFDIICTDAFLTRFDKKNAKSVVDSWNKLLKKDGVVVTTVRIHNGNDKEFDKETCIKEFIERAKNEYKKYQKYISVPIDEFLKLVENYARKMKSNNLGNVTDIISLFDNYKVYFNENAVKGELHKTNYLEIIAKK